MPTPIAPRIIFAQNARVELQTVVRAQTTPQSLALRARMILRAAALDRPTNRTIGRELSCSNLTVGTWRRRSVDRGFPGLHDAIRAGRPRAIVSPTRVQVISVARTWPQDQDRTVPRWTLDALVATLRETLHTAPISRSRIWRLLHDVDLKPHKSAYGLNSHEEDCAATAHDSCQLYPQALAFFEPGRLVICGDEKTGRHILERTASTTPAHPGRRERREHAYIRHGTRVLINSLAVATGHRA